jgi:hypothetical protein
MMPNAGNAGAYMNDARLVEVRSPPRLAPADLRHAVSEEVVREPFVLVRSNRKGAQDENQREMREVAQAAHVSPKLRAKVRLSQEQ